MGGGDAGSGENHDIITIEPLNVGFDHTSILSFPSSVKEQTNGSMRRSLILPISRHSTNSSHFEDA